jgi:WD40 repeat protein
MRRHRCRRYEAMRPVSSGGLFGVAAVPVFGGARAVGACVRAGDPVRVGVAVGATVADLDRLLPQPPPALAGVVEVLRTATSSARPLSSDRRARLYALAAAHLGHPDLTRRFAQLTTTTARGEITQPPRWAQTIFTPHQQMTGHTDWVRAVAPGRVGDRHVIVSGSYDRTVRIWDAHTGQPVRAPLTGHTGPVLAVALGRVGDRDMIVSGSRDRTVRIWEALGKAEYLIFVQDCLAAVHAVALAPGLLVLAVGQALCAIAMAIPRESPR